LSLESRMNMLLERLRLAYRAVWCPQDSPRHAEIDVEQRLILIYDKDEIEAWISLLHEVLEIRLRRVLNVYRGLVNKLIEFVDGQVYREKERVLEDCIRDFRLWNELAQAASSHKHKGGYGKNGRIKGES